MSKKADPPDGCPYCTADGSEITYDNVEIDGSMAEQQCYCNKCGAAWWELYEFVGIEYNKEGSNRLEDPE